MFWKSHNPIAASRGSQYKSAIWFADDNQLETINKTVEPLLSRYDRELTTDILPLDTFYNAEDYHQKYCLQRHGELMKSFGEMYSKFQSFVNSTAAARLNGFSMGRGNKKLFEVEKESYGFDITGLKKLFRF